MKRSSIEARVYTTIATITGREDGYIANFPHETQLADLGMTTDQVAELCKRIDGRALNYAPAASSIGDVIQFLSKTTSRK